MITVVTLRKRLARLRGQHQVQRLGRGDQDVGWSAQQTAAFACVGVAGADADGRHVGKRCAQPAGFRLDARERCPQVLLDVDGECPQRRDVEHPRPPLAFGRRLGREAVDRPQERGERLARTGRRKQQCVAALGDRGPPLALGVGRRSERGLEPGPGGGRERGEGHDPPTLPARSDTVVRLAPGSLLTTFGAPGLVCSPHQLGRVPHVIRRMRRWGDAGEGATPSLRATS